MIGRTIDNFRIDRALGQGGLGTVYLATDIQNQRKVALKLVHPHLAANAQFQQRFTETVQSIAAMDHAHIVRVLAYGTQANELYTVTEYIPGGNLGAHLRSLARGQQRAGPAEAARLGQQIAHALEYAHHLNLPHLNLKPTNILMRPQGDGQSQSLQALVSDFGMSWLAANVTGADTLQGNLPYMAPEQVRGERIDARVDVYALGALLYEITTGRPPFQPRSFNDAVRIHNNEAVVPPSRVVPGVPAELDQLIVHSLSKNPNDRPQSAPALARALQAAASGPASGANASGQTMPPAVAQLKTSFASRPLTEAMPQYDSFPADTVDVGRARLIVSRQGQAATSVWVDKDVLLVGRDENQDITLQGEQVSRSHSRIDRGYDGRFRIMDLGSTNGVWMGTTRLPPNTPYEWQPGQVVRIGEFWLKLDVITTPGRSNGAQSAGAVNHQSMPPEVVPATGMIESTTDRFNARLLSSALTIAPGNRAIVKVEVENKGETADTFSLEFRGVPTDWLSLPAAQPIIGKGKGTFQVTLHPPRTSSSVAGAHVFDVVVHSSQNPAEYITQPGNLQIESFHSFTADVQPRRLRADRAGALMIHNTGNASETYAISVEEPEKALDIRLDQTPVTVAPGQTEHLPMQARPRSRPFAGSSRDAPFKVTVKATRPNGDQQQQTAALIVTPLLPYWLLGVLGFSTTACTVVTLVGLLALGPRLIPRLFGAGGQPGTPTATIAPDSTGGAPGLLDSDGDGLSDEQETRSYGTDPNNPDTDNDNLTDGDEVRRTRTSPTNPDTDGDGIPDGADPAPLATPSPTVDVLATQTADQGQIGATEAAVTQTAQSDALQTQIAAGTQAIAGLTQTAAANPSATPVTISITIDDPSQIETGSGSTTTLAFNVTLSQTGLAPITVAYNTVNGSATAGSDFTAQSNTITFNPGQMSQSINITVMGDDDIEPDETLSVVLSNPGGAVIAKGTGNGVIRNDDPTLPLPVVNINDPSNLECNLPGTGMVTFTVSVSPPSSHPEITLGYQTADGSAQDGNPGTEDDDYVAANTTVTIPMNAPSAAIDVNVICDNISEANETFSVILNPTANVTLAKGTGTATLINDDAPAALPLVSVVDPMAVNESAGTITFDVSLAPANPGPGNITVEFSTVNGSAIAPGDYTTQSGMLIFGPGDMNQPITVNIINDAFSESDETFSLVLVNPTGATISVGTAVGTILNEDGAIAICLTDSSAPEGDTEGRDMTFTITLSQPNPGPGNITVDYTTVDNSATEPGDYIQQNGTLVFGMGQASQNISISIVGDDLPGANENFLLDLVGGSEVGASISTVGSCNDPATGTIIDDD